MPPVGVVARWGGGRNPGGCIAACWATVPPPPPPPPPSPTPDGWGGRGVVRHGGANTVCRFLLSARELSPPPGSDLFVLLLLLLLLLLRLRLVVRARTLFRLLLLLLLLLLPPLPLPPPLPLTFAVPPLPLAATLEVVAVVVVVEVSRVCVDVLEVLEALDDADDDAEEEEEEGGEVALRDLLALLDLLAFEDGLAVLALALDGFGGAGGSSTRPSGRFVVEPDMRLCRNHTSSPMNLSETRVISTTGSVRGETSKANVDGAPAVYRRMCKRRCGVETTRLNASMSFVA